MLTTIFENSKLLVQVNSNTNEVFVTNKGNKNTSDLKTDLRISTHKNGLDITTNGSWNPKSFHGLGGFHIN